MDNIEDFEDLDLTDESDVDDQADTLSAGIFHIFQKVRLMGSKPQLIMTSTLQLALINHSHGPHQWETATTPSITLASGSNPLQFLVIGYSNPGPNETSNIISYCTPILEHPERTEVQWVGLGPFTLFPLPRSFAKKPEYVSEQLNEDFARYLKPLQAMLAPAPLGARTRKLETDRAAGELAVRSGHFNRSSVLAKIRMITLDEVRNAVGGSAFMLLEQVDSMKERLDPPTSMAKDR